MPDDAYYNNLLKLAREASQGYENILYVSVSRPAEALIKEFKKNNIDSKKFFFIDCISQTVSVNEEAQDTVLIRNPGAQNDLAREIDRVLSEKKTKLIILDSPSSLVIYSDPENVIRFIHTIITKLELSDCKGIFPALYDEENPMFLKQIEMFADAVLDLRT